MHDYVQDCELNLFRRQGFPGIARTDEEEAERRIYDAVCRAGDRSTFSLELPQAITDWPSEYHLSRRRHCLLRPIAIRPGDKVLELGCGGGAITEFLGELGAEVTALEASLRLASIASERCRDLRNVKVFLDDVLDFQSSDRFDWVLVVGMLEYAPVFSDAADPINHYLSIVGRFLGPRGKLVIAIENKFGLKYFNGCAEDHVGVPFYGIQGLYGPHAPRTLGRQELESHLTSIGLRNKDFYYPFPDHKLPAVIISHRALAEPSFDPADLLASCHARDYRGLALRHFDDALVLAQAASSNLLADLSNSFLIVASADCPAARQTDVDLAVAYAVDRVPEFVTQTRFVLTGEGIQVIKEPLTGISRRKTVKNGSALENLVGRSDYLPGRLLLWRVLRVRAESVSLSAVVDALKPWFELLLRYAADREPPSTEQKTIKKKLSDYVVPGSCLDMTPYNLMETDNGLVPIDLEWKLDGVVPLGWVTTRSVSYCLRIGVPLQNPRGATADVVRALCSAQDIELSANDIDDWLELESEFQAIVAVSRPASSLSSFRGVLADREGQIVKLISTISERDAEIVRSIESIRQRDARLEQLQEVLADRDCTISERDAEVARSTESIWQHEAQLEQLQEALAERTISERDAEIARSTESIWQRDAQLHQLQEALAERDRTISERDAEIARSTESIWQRDAQLGQLQEALASTCASTSWRITAPLRSARGLVRRMWRKRLDRELVIGWPILRSSIRRRLRERADRGLIASAGLFDSAWYLQQNPDVRVAGIDPALHYLRFGAREGRDPSPYFDSDWYLQRNPDVRNARINPLVHYLSHGAAEGRRPSQSTNDLNLISVDGRAIEWKVPSQWQTVGKRNPLVSLLVVNYNGIRHLPNFFRSLQSWSYTNIEIIIVDNASSDGSDEFLRSKLPETKLVLLDHNVGFAEANNIAFELSRGEYIFVLNNDTRCDRQCLDHLVAALVNDPGLGAVGPKIRFWTKFSRVQIELTQPETILIDINELVKASPHYEKFFFREGFSEPFMYQSRLVRRITGKSEFAAPSYSVRRGIDLHVYAEGVAQMKVRTGRASSEHILTSNAWQTIRLSSNESMIEAQWLINNAGSDIAKNGAIRDRGLGQADDGTFDAGDEPTALCGCAMLIRRSALSENEPLFASRFFAYFEDTDLSVRIRQKGYRLAYCPKSIVYHKHASTSTENSAFFRYYVNRNRILFYALHFPESFWRPQLTKSQLELTHLKKYYNSPSCTQEEREFSQKIENIFTDWECLIPQITKGQFYKRKRHFPRFAVYNSFWNTKGGGEYHATVLAEALQTRGPVDLISEEDFSIEELERLFDVNLSGCRKLIVSAPMLHHNERVTSGYDVLVNSTFGSDLISHANQSVYVVSFPFSLNRRPLNSRNFLPSYRFYLANSAYTMRWCKQLWDVDVETLYPSMNVNRLVWEKGTIEKKRPIILNVGRFFRHGHSKKQLELVGAFKDLVSQLALGPNWKLILAGQVQRDQEDYFSMVLKHAEGLNVDLQPNISREKLFELYQQAAIYVHATGLDEDLETFPERAEHFGIATLEAMAFGCVPIVIRAGGQPEIVQEGQNGFLFSNLDELKKMVVYVAQMFAGESCDAYRSLSSNARARSGEFSRARTQEQFLELITRITRPDKNAYGSIQRNGAIREEFPSH